MKETAHLIYFVTFLSLTWQSCSTDKTLLKIQFENEIITGQIIKTDSIPSQFNPLDTIEIRGQGFQNYPNPFSPTMSVNFNVFSDDTVSIKFYEINGSLLSEPFIGFLAKEKYLLKLFASKLNAGVYFVMVCSGNKGYMRKILIL